MEVLVYYILFISAVLIAGSCVNIKKVPRANKKLLDNMEKLNKKEHD